MKVSIVTIGARGDVQPYAALALGLRARGHDVLVATLERFRWLIEPLDLPFRSLEHEPFRLLGDALLAARPHTVAREWTQLATQVESAFDQWHAAAMGADVLVTHPLVFAAPDIAEALGIPLIVASTLPVACPTRVFPNSYVASRSWGGIGNRLSYALLPTVLSPLAALRARWRRRRLGLQTPMTPLTGSARRVVHHVHGYSPQVLPAPADWPPHFEVTGYWRTGPAQPQGLPAALERFLDAGAAPIYVGFGSMRWHDSATLTRTVVEASLAVGRRVIVAPCTGALSAGVARSYDEARVLALDDFVGVAHEQLFPRVAAVVHHGGPGTLGSALHAGRPQVLCPFAMDQPFWARRAHALGVAPAPLPIRRITVERLADRLRDVLENPVHAERAAELATKLGREDGIGATIDRIEQITNAAVRAPVGHQPGPHPA